MTDLRTAAQQALEVIGDFLTDGLCPFKADKAFSALHYALAEPVQEPVAYAVGRTLHWHEGKGVNDAQLYLAPPQRKPLTEEEIYGMYSEPSSDAEMVEFARAVERAHGITP